jgi:hypothetical protein
MALITYLTTIKFGFGEIAGDQASGVDALAEQERRQHHDPDRGREPDRHRVRQRQIGDGEIKQRDLAGAEDHAQDLKARPFGPERAHHALLEDERQQQREARSAAQQQYLADRIGGDQPFPHHVVEREHQDAEEHHDDAVQGRVS